MKKNNQEAREFPIAPGVGVVIGRFQTHYLHKGHLALLDRVKLHELGIVVIGCAATPVTKKNPMDFQTRRLMVQEYVGPNVVVIPAYDHASDVTWSNNLDRKIKEVNPTDKEVFLYHSRDSFKDHYHGEFKTVEIDAITEENATRIREEVGKNPIDSDEFRAGVIYASQNMYPRVQPTVDVIVYNDKNEILLGRKPGSTKYCFVGGFVDMTDQTAQLAATRELHEETGLEVDPSRFVYVGTFKVNDWRDTTNTSVMTTCFKVAFSNCFNPNKEVEAADDIEEVKWFNHNYEDDILENLIPAHHVLFKAFKA